MQKAYAKLEGLGGGTVRLDDIAKNFDCSLHPSVVSGKRSEEELYMDFMSLWDTQVKEGIVSLDEFCQYYSDCACGCSDEDFEKMMKDAWKYE